MDSVYRDRVSKMRWRGRGDKSRAVAGQHDATTRSIARNRTHPQIAVNRLGGTLRQWHDVVASICKLLRFQDGIYIRPGNQECSTLADPCGGDKENHLAHRSNGEAGGYLTVRLPGGVQAKDGRTGVLSAIAGFNR